MVLCETLNIRAISRVGSPASRRLIASFFWCLGSFTQRYVKRHSSRPPFLPDFEVPGYDPAVNIALLVVGFSFQQPE
jgi:hypothetical protein